MTLFGKNAAKEALKNNDLAISKVYLLDGGDSKEIIALCKARKASFTFVKSDALKRLANNDKHQGIVVQATEFVYANVDKVIEDLRQRDEKTFFMITSEIADTHNLGAIIRSADFAGVNCVIVSKNNSASINETVFKTSAGAAFNLPIVLASNIAQMVEKLKKQNIFVYGLEVGGKDYLDIDYTGDIAIIVGGEDAGIKPLVKKLCDEVVQINNAGKVSSLNASVASAVVLFEAKRQRQV